MKLNIEGDPNHQKMEKYLKQTTLSIKSEMHMVFCHGELYSGYWHQRSDTNYRNIKNTGVADQENYNVLELDTSLRA